MRYYALPFACALACATVLTACPEDPATGDTAVAEVSDAGDPAEVAADLPPEADLDTSTDGGVDGDAGVDAQSLDISLDGGSGADTFAGDASDAKVADASDVAEVDTAGADSGGEIDDAGGPGETVWGSITGDSCGTLTTALQSPDPSFHVTTWTFDSATFDPTLLLDPGPKQRFEEPNAGGSSKCSEVMSMTWLMACEDAAFYKTETQIVYDVTGSITDYEMTVAGDKIGISVTRAYLGPFTTDYTAADATTLLTKKLEGVNESTVNVSAGDAWTKQILHIWTLQPDWVPILESVWTGLDATLKADTVVLVTIEDGSDFVVTDSCDD